LGSQELNGGGLGKKLIVYDFDATLAESKSSLGAEMAALLHDLLGVIKVAVISRGNWPQFGTQLLSHLPHDERLANLSLLPTCVTKFYQFSGDWNKLYGEDFTEGQREKIRSSLKKALAAAGFKVDKIWGDEIEDRGSQITYSALGQQASSNKRRNGILIAPNEKRSKPSLTPMFPSFLSASVARLLLISPSRALIRLAALESLATSWVFH